MPIPKTTAASFPLCLLIVIGCQQSVDEPGDTLNNNAAAAEAGGDGASKQHPALIAANEILTAIRNSDSVAIKKLFNETNRTRIADEDLYLFFSDSKETIGDVTEITEIRQDDRRVVAKLRQVDDEVFVIVMTEEDGQFLLEDINSPPVDLFNTMPKLN